MTLPKKTTTVERVPDRIKEEISLWKNRLAEAEKARETLQGERTRLEEERKRLLLDAAAGSADAKGRLAELRERIMRLDLEAEETKTLADEIKAKLQALDADLVATLRDVELAKLRRLAEERFRLAGEVQELIDKLADAIGRHAAVSKDGYAVCQRVQPQAANLWLVKNRVFGYLCYKLNQHFPMDLPRALAIDCCPLTETERRMLSGFLPADAERQEAPAEGVQKSGTPSGAV